MALILTEEQELLKETAREFVTENAPVSQLRELRDTTDASGFSRDLWKQMAELGWAGIILPEEFGGSDLGFAELGLVMEEAGRTLAATPLLSTVVLGGSAILLGGSDAQKKDLLPAVSNGEKLLALAYQETPHHHPYRVATRAEGSKDGFCLTGEKLFVLDGHVADHLIVTARTSGADHDRDGIALFLVDAGTPGLRVRRTLMVDGRNAAKVRLDGVEVDKSRAIGRPGQGAELLDAVLDRGMVALSAEMLGTAQEAFDRTLKYLKERKQFGVPIGSFQALKHRAADLFCELELLRSIVLEALRAVDAGRPDLSKLASICKARASDTVVQAGNEGVQMHGGIGTTDEEDIGLFLKRAKVTALTFGDAPFHRDRYAELESY